MAVFINLAADPVTPRIVEIKTQGAFLFEDGIQHDFINIFHYRWQSGPGTTDLQSLVNAFQTSVVNTFAPLLNVRVTAVTSFARPLDDPLAISVQENNGPIAGAVTGDPLSSVLAAVVQMTTGVRGRSFKGSKHFGGLSESNTDGGDELKAATISSWGAVLTALESAQVDSGGNSYIPCVLSPTLSTILGTPPTFTGADLDAALLNPILGTMRRRKERVNT